MMREDLPLELLSEEQLQHETANGQPLLFHSPIDEIDPNIYAVVLDDDYYILGISGPIELHTSTTETVFELDPVKIPITSEGKITSFALVKLSTEGVHRWAGPHHGLTTEHWVWVGDEAILSDLKFTYVLGLDNHGS